MVGWSSFFFSEHARRFGLGKRAARSCCWRVALHVSDAISRVRSPAARAAVWTRYSPLLFVHSPEEFATAAAKPELSNVDLWKLLPTFLLSLEATPKTCANSEKASALWQSATRVLKKAVQKTGTAPRGRTGVCLSAGLCMRPCIHACTCQAIPRARVSRLVGLK